MKINTRFIEYKKINEKKYDYVIKTKSYFNYGEYEGLINGLEITVKGLRESKSILVYGAFYDDQDKVIVKGDILYLSTSYDITKVSLTTCNIEAELILDDDTSFGLYEAPEEGHFIIHGELSIIMIDGDLNIIWQYQLPDISIPMSGKDPFKVADGYIYVKDFNNDYYYIGYDGKLISSSNSIYRKGEHRYYLHEYNPNIEYPDDAVFIKRDENESENWDEIMKELDDKLKRLQEAKEND